MHFEISEQTRSETYALIVWLTGRSVPLYPTSQKIGIHDLESTASVNMVRLLRRGLREPHNGKEFLKKPNEETARKTKKCVLVTQRKYAQNFEKL